MIRHFQLCMPYGVRGISDGILIGRHETTVHRLGKRSARGKPGVCPATGGNAAPLEQLASLHGRRVWVWCRMHRKVRGLAWQMQIAAVIICLPIPETTMGQKSKERCRCPAPTPLGLVAYALREERLSEVTPSSLKSRLCGRVGSSCARFGRRGERLRRRGGHQLAQWLEAEQHYHRSGGHQHDCHRELEGRHERARCLRDDAAHIR